MNGLLELRLAGPQWSGLTLCGFSEQLQIFIYMETNEIYAPLALIQLVVL